MNTLEKALDVAWDAAKGVANNYPESRHGSANLDRAYMHSERDSAKKRERIERRGFLARYRKGWGFMLYPQGIECPEWPEWKGCREARRTAMAEAVAESLAKSGYPASVFYKMD